MILRPVPLTATGFKEFGQVVELKHARQYPINNGLTTRFHDLVSVDTELAEGRTIVNVFRTDPIPLPHRIEKMERHPLGSQAFIPMEETPFLVLVGKPKNNLTAHDLLLFKTNGRQGVNLYRNTWHHFQLVLDHTQDFIVVDRGGPGDNLEETDILEEVWIR